MVGRLIDSDWYTFDSIKMFYFLFLRGLSDRGCADIMEFESGAGEGISFSGRLTAQISSQLEHFCYKELVALVACFFIEFALFWQG